MNNSVGMQVWLSKRHVQAFYEGLAVTAFKECPGDPDNFRHINVAGDEVMKDYGKAVSIVKHY